MLEIVCDVYLKEEGSNRAKEEVWKEGRSMEREEEEEEGWRDPVVE